MRGLPAAIRGLVLDHLAFKDVLSATTTDSGGRAALSFLSYVSLVNGHVMIQPGMVNKLDKCEHLIVRLDHTEEMGQLTLAFQIMRHLRAVTISFTSSADLNHVSWRKSCADLARSAELGRFREFNVYYRGSFISGDEFNLENFTSILFRLPPDCALATALGCPRIVPSTIFDLLRRVDGKLLNARWRIPFPRRWLSELICPLERACAKQRIEVIRVLLEAGARVPKFNEVDAFLWALGRKEPENPSENSSLDVIRLLYDFGLTSASRTFGEEKFNLLHYLVCSLTEHLSHDSILAMAELICTREPELLTQVCREGFTPLALLTAVQFEFRPEDHPKLRTDFVGKLGQLLARREAKVRRPLD